MSYYQIDRKSELSIKQDDLLASKRYVIERKPDIPEFYELEEAVVLDVIMDENHPEVKNSRANPDDWPKNIDGSKVSSNELDYGMIGKIKFRFLNSERGQIKESLNWAYPINNTGVTEWPLMNEIVIVGRYLGRYFYLKKLNFKSVVNSNASFITERVAGHVEENRNEYSADGKYKGPVSVMNASGEGGNNYQGILGSYFKFNPNIRTLKRFEGDTILESRFGSSIRFGAYDANRSNDSGEGEYSDKGGNPMVLIRNRQATIKTPQGKTAKGYTIEDLNKDGSSIHMTSGKTVSMFRPTTELSPINLTRGVAMPRFQGDQIVINSDRLIFSSKANETLFYSKGFVGITSDRFVSITAKGNTTITSTEGLIAFNARKVYLGVDKDGPNDEPVILGGQLTTWLYAMCDSLATMLNNNIQILTTLMLHNHVATGPLAPTTPPFPPFILAHADQMQSVMATQAQLVLLRSQISSLQSSKAFVGK